MSSENRQQQAIADYLQALLEEVPDSPASKEAVVEESKPAVIGLEKLIETVPDTYQETERLEQPAEVIEVVEQAQPEPVFFEVPEDIVPVEEVEVPVVVTPVSSEAMIPEWGQDPFQCLLFKVSGLTLAVPLIKLKSVMPWTDRIVETPNQTEWYLGLVQNHGTNVKVIDTALMVLPENRRDMLNESSETRFSHILLVNDGQWGLACDSIGDVIWLTSDKVKWRKNKLKRPWLAGTALDYLCALMDTDVFADMLNEQTG